MQSPRAAAALALVFVLVLAGVPDVPVAAAQNDSSPAPAAAASAGDSPLFSGPVVISEVLGKPANASVNLASITSWPVLTSAVEWVELANKGPAEVNLSGWTLVRADKDVARGWKVPASLKLPPSGFCLILCPKHKEVLPPLPAAATNIVAAEGVKIGKDGLALYAPDGSLVASTGRLPKDTPGVTVGLPQPAAAAGSAPYTFLATPTPWAANSAPKPGIGPFIRGLKADPDGFVGAGADIVISAKVRPNQAPIGAVTLLMRVNYGPEQEVPMTPKAGSEPGPDGEVAYSATIPGRNLTAGQMVRWRVKATDAASGSSVDPNGLGANAPQYEGTVVTVPAAEAVAANVSVPVLYWFTDNPAAATTTGGAPGSLAFQGSFYDNVMGRRRGVTSLVWLKPKLKFKVPEGFIMREDVPSMTTVKLNSYYSEIGERSYMKEALAYQVMANEGVIAPLNQYVQVYLNGQFYGLYGMIEKLDSNMLERYNLSKSGPLFKSNSGELSNLRWDLPLAEMPSYYSKPNRKQYSGDWALLANFTRGLAGGGPVSRTSFLFDNLTLPAVINEAAVNALLLNQDRCTKNFYIYYNPDKAEWLRVPWDVEQSFAQDNGLGGTPGPYYCVLACEQWNSPLYCDSEHPQDLGNVQTPWGTITAVGMNTYSGAAVPSRGRRLAQVAAPLPAEGTKPLTFPKPDDWSNPDRVQYGTRSIVGATGTYNHLTDALFDVPATRAMYLRRLHTLADKYYGQNELRKLVDATWARISGLAAQDNGVWKVGDGSRGYTQITTEFIPIRSKQLLQTYAPGGANPLLPGPQDNSKVSLGVAAVETSGPRKQSYVALTLSAPAGEAVDVSGWNITVTGTGTSWTFPQGAVIPPNGKVYLSPNVIGFRARPTSPKAGEAAFVLEVPDELIPAQGSGASWSLVDDKGAPIRFS